MKKVMSLRLSDEVRALLPGLMQRWNLSAGGVVERLILEAVAPTVEDLPEPLVPAATAKRMVEEERVSGTRPGTSSALRRTIPKPGWKS